MHYANGNSYKGSFIMGEKHGLGVFLTHDGESYHGSWSMNLKEGNSWSIIIGDGVYNSRYGDVIRGTFL